MKDNKLSEINEIDDNNEINEIQLASSRSFVGKRENVNEKLTQEKKVKLENKIFNNANKITNIEKKITINENNSKFNFSCVEIFCKCFCSRIKNKLNLYKKSLKKVDYHMNILFYLKMLVVM